MKRISALTAWRVINTKDLVSKLPPLGHDCTDLMYAHVSGNHEITVGVTLPDLPDFNDFNCDQIAENAAILAYSASNLDDIVTDHEMCTYFKTLCNQGSDTSISDQKEIGCDSECVSVNPLFSLMEIGTDGFSESAG